MGESGLVRCTGARDLVEVLDLETNHLRSRTQHEMRPLDEGEKATWVQRKVISCVKGGGDGGGGGIVVVVVVVVMVLMMVVMVMGGWWWHASRSRS